MSHVLKIIIRVILRRTKPLIENEIDKMQSGFMSGKGTREGILNMRLICKKYLEERKIFMFVL